MRKWLLASLGAVVAVAAAGTVIYMVSFQPEPPPAGHPKPPKTVSIKRTDLSTSVTLDGNLGYGTATSFTGRKSGTVTWLPSPGTVVNRGQRLYSVDAKPTALFLGDTPLYRTIDDDAEPGPDIAEVNANLRALGYTAAPDSDHYTAGTAAALTRWERHIGLDDTGALRVGDVAVLPAPVRVDSLKAQAGAKATTELMTLTSTEKRVTADVNPNKVDTSLLTNGRSVTLSLPDNTKTSGTVTSLTSSEGSSGGKSQPAGGNGHNGQSMTLTVTIDDQSTVSETDSGAVEVTVPTGSAKDVLAVPVQALVAVQGGGFALQVVTGHRNTSRLVGVDTGIFANGLVEVSGQGITEGLKVVTVS